MKPFIQVSKKYKIEFTSFEKLKLNEGRTDIMYGFSLKKAYFSLHFFTKDENEAKIWCQQLATYTLRKKIKEKYKFEEEIGKGSYGTVHLAYKIEDNF